MKNVTKVLIGLGVCFLVASYLLRPAAMTFSVIFAFVGVAFFILAAIIQD